MSVHKSQGSEFKIVMFCLPPKKTPILTRELIYTGLTRAKKEAIVIGPPDVLKESILARVQRGSHLSHRVSQNESPSFLSRL